MMVYRIGACCLFLLLLFAPATRTQAEDVVLVADPWPPFNMAPESDLEGYIIDIAREVFKPPAYRVIYKTVPWKRALLGTRLGDYNGAVGASKGDAAGFVFPSEALSRNYLSFFVRKDDPWVFRDQSSIENVTIGVAAGYDYRKWLNDYIQAHKEDYRKVQIVSSEAPLKQNLDKLIAGRIDVIIGNEAVIRYTAREGGLINEIKNAGYGREPAYIYIAFSPALANSKQLASLLSDGIIELRHNGRLKTILDRYGLADWK